MISKIVADYDNGMTTRDLSFKYGKSLQSIRRTIKLHGTPRKPGGQVTYDPQRAVDLWEAGKTLDEIASVIGVNRNSIYKQLVSLGIDTSDRRNIDRRAVRDLLEQGLSDCDISEALGCSIVTISNIRRIEFNLYIKDPQLYVELDNNAKNSITFDEFRKQYPNIDYSTLVKYYDKHHNNRENKQNDYSHFNDKSLEIIEKLQAGVLKSEIMRDHNLTKSHVDTIIAVNDVNYRPKSHRMLDDVHKLLNNPDWCELMMLEHNSYKTICEILGNVVDISTVQNYVNKHGLQVRSVFEIVRELQDGEWLKAEYSTKSYAQIADDLGVSHPIVRDALIHHQIEIKRDMHVSKIEKQVVDFIKSIYSGSIIKNDRCQIQPQELDIYMPEMNIAIEICGLYWHSEKFKAKEYHKDKMEACWEKGIRLITIFEDELIYTREIVESKLKSILGVAANSIYARLCEVREVDSNQAADFFNTNHIQGSTVCSIRYGLYYEDQLVSIMAFKRRKNNVFELVRFASSKRIVGGFSKLLSTFKQRNDWREIFTFADLRWSDRQSNVYVKSGFNEECVTNVDYSYYDNRTKRRYHRMNFSRKLLPNKLKIFDEKLTERQNMNVNGFLAIYDCGKIKYNMVRVDE